MVWQKILGGYLLAVGTVLLANIEMPLIVAVPIIVLFLASGFGLLYWVYQVEEDLKAPLGYKLGKIYTKIKKMDPDKTYKNLHHLDKVAHVARDEHNGFFSLPVGYIGDPEVRKLWIRTIEADIKMRDEHVEKQIKKDNST